MPRTDIRVDSRSFIGASKEESAKIGEAESEGSRGRICIVSPTLSYFSEQCEIIATDSREWI